jgi:hypothetical protein
MGGQKEGLLLFKKQTLFSFPLQPSERRCFTVRKIRCLSLGEGKPKMEITWSYTWKILRHLILPFSSRRREAWTLSKIILRENWRQGSHFLLRKSYIWAPVCIAIIALAIQVPESPKATQIKEVVVVKEVTKVEKIESTVELKEFVIPVAEELGYSPEDCPIPWNIFSATDAARWIMEDYAQKNYMRFYTFRHIPTGSPLKNGIVRTKFGVSVNAAMGGLSYKGPHTGVDFPAELGTEVIATADGRVKIAKNLGEWGNLVVISHGEIDGELITTYYAHLQDLKVYVGQDVRRGDIIGKVGVTGLATGPHLHYEVKIFPTKIGIPTNPEYWLPPECFPPVNQK